MSDQQKPRYGGALAMLTSLFFMWGFLTCMNDILVPYLKGVFELSHFQANLVQFAFFGAYFVGSVAYFAISLTLGDPLARMGYKRGIVIGLLVSALGVGLFHPAASMRSFPFFLSALFVLGLGFTLLQISANPFVSILGSERTASARLNLAQGVNSLGTTLAPMIGGVVIFRIYGTADTAGADAVKVPYLVFSAVLIALAVLFALRSLPDINEASGPQRPGRTGLGALRFPHLRLGMLAIFFYVGAEVAVGSNLIAFLGDPAIAGLGERAASPFVGIYWGGLMIGRFLGALSLSGDATRKRLMPLIPIAGFLFLGLSLAVTKELPLGETLGLMLPFTAFLVLNYGAFVLGRSQAGRTTGVFAIFSAALLVCAALAPGQAGMWCVLGVGLFNSVMWSNVFTLSIEGLGEHKSQASSLLVMAIVGGALYPPLQGAVADAVGIRSSMLVPAIAYLYIGYFGFIGHRVGRDASAPQLQPGGVA